jgi:AcrR family transcriptional regulator
MQNSPAPPPRGRGRPRAFDREAALAQAMRLFWRKGYAATSVADLTGAMGIGAPSLYAAFGSKEALYAEALRCYGALYEPQIWSRFDAAATAREAVEALLMDTAAAWARCDGPRGCMVTLSGAEGEGSAELGALLRSERARTLARVEERLARAATEGELPDTVDRAALARFVLAVQGGLSLQARDGAGRAELEAVARVAMAGWAARVGG